MSIRTLKCLTILLPLFSAVVSASLVGYEAARRASCAAELRETQQKYERLTARLKSTPAFDAKKFHDSHAHEHSDNDDHDEH